MCCHVYFVTCTYPRRLAVDILKDVCGFHSSIREPLYLIMKFLLINSRYSLPGMVFSSMKLAVYLFSLLPIV